MERPVGIWRLSSLGLLETSALRADRSLWHPQHPRSDVQAGEDPAHP